MTDTKVLGDSMALLMRIDMAWFGWRFRICWVLLRIYAGLADAGVMIWSKAIGVKERIANRWLPLARILVNTLPDLWVVESCYLCFTTRISTLSLLLHDVTWCRFYS